MVPDGERALFLVEFHMYGEVARIVCDLSGGSKDAQFLCGIDGVRDQLAKEYLMVGIKKFFNDGENVLSLNIDLAFLHNSKIFFNAGNCQTICQGTGTDILAGTLSPDPSLQKVKEDP